MNKVFLSHSSKQKGYVEIIARKLGKSKVIYDKFTFEEASKTIEEIYKGIEESGIFVFFISNDALNSDWVKKEIFLAEKYIKEGKLKKFLPIIIDNTITYDDNRIPDWINSEYNLRYISKPTKSYELITQALRTVSWDLIPKNKELDQLFIGRTEYIKKFEERIFNFDLPIPNTLIISGMNLIGRRKFITHVLKNTNHIKEYYSPPIITLDNRNSIEDFIIKTYGLGYSNLTAEDITGLIEANLEKKIDISYELIKELDNFKNILFILDNYSIVNNQGIIADWFIELNEKLIDLNNINICLISRSRARRKQIIRIKNIFSIDLPELEPYERKALFNSLLKIEDIELSRNDFKTISEIFSGFPEQIKYTINLIKEEGTNYVKNNLHEIVEYNTEQVRKVIKKFEEDNLALQILKILSEAEAMSINVLYSILEDDDFEKARKIISELSNSFIIEYIGSSKEFLRLNDTIKDYIQRLGYDLEKKYKNNIELHAKKAFKDYELIDRDISDFVISFKEALKLNIPIPKKFLIPSHYVNAMRELYNYERKYSEVIKLADRILINENQLDKRIVHEIRYWLCLALARKRNNRILEVVQRIEGPDHNFLLGFYYRIIGNYERATEKFLEVLRIRPNFYRAKRELVQVYLNTEQYQEALELAKDNYYMDTNNPYNAQSYFRCLIKTNEKYYDKDELKKVLKDIEKSPHEKASEMFQTSNAYYIYIIENNPQKAIEYINETISTFPKNLYPYLTKLEILNKINNIELIKKTIEEIEKKWADKDFDIYNKLPFIKAKISLLKNEGKANEARELIEKKVKNKFSDNIYREMIIHLKT